MLGADGRHERVHLKFVRFKGHRLARIELREARFNLATLGGLDIKTRLHRGGCDLLGCAPLACGKLSKPFRVSVGQRKRYC
ncbi:MAG TPA: hypothetical protein PLS69_13800 [Terricaulis sp.]|nr:hypothetical protein [Terricaulis sp.]